MLCSILDLEKSGTKEAVMERILGFLVNPQDSGRPLQKPKRSMCFLFVLLSHFESSFKNITNYKYIKEDDTHLGSPGLEN